MVGLPRPSQILPSLVKIELKNQDYLQSVLIAIVIIEKGWLNSLFQQNHSGDLISKIREFMKNKIENKPNTIDTFIRIHNAYNLRTTKEAKEWIENLASEVDLSHSQPDSFFDSFKSLYIKYIEESIN